MVRGERIVHTLLFILFTSHLSPLAFSRMVIAHIIRYAHQPRLEGGETSERGNVCIGFDERILCQVVTQLFIAHGLAQEEPADR